MFKLPDIASKMEACKQYTVSEKCTGYEQVMNLHRSLDQLNIEKELELAMKSLNCNSDETSEKTIEHQECSECSAKQQEITCLKESISLLEQRLQCVCFYRKLYSTFVIFEN